MDGQNIKIKIIGLDDLVLVVQIQLK